MHWGGVCPVHVVGNASAGKGETYGEDRAQVLAHGPKWMGGLGVCFFVDALFCVICWLLETEDDASVIIWIRFDGLS